ncbi:hypothetical protein H2248_005396 [Termitomyces sp. 'cryptogamus']|nr:hypothetical protein H2248_005396 [Termitomyces sp. 'cryptogamus']
MPHSTHEHALTQLNSGSKFYSLDYIAFRLICEFVYLDPVSPKYPKRDLCLISTACFRLREASLPLIFNEVHNLRLHREFVSTWPSTIWPYIRKVHVHDKTHLGKMRDVPVKVNNLDVLLPRLNNLNHLVFHLESLPEALLEAISPIPLKTVEFLETRFDIHCLPGVLSRMDHLTSLALTVMPERSPDIDTNQEFEIVETILRTVASRLRRLEISGDLIQFSTLAQINWPELHTLCMVGHVPSSRPKPFSVVINHMPSLRNLHCNFSAGHICRQPTVFLSDHGANLPDLENLSISNLRHEDLLIDHLPKNLRVFRILALRDIYGIRTFRLQNPQFYTALDDDNALRWVRAVAKLPHLIELALTLEQPPSPTLLELIAESCPKLQTLELEQAEFEQNNRCSAYSMEMFVRPLSRLKDLRKLLITIEIGPHDVWDPFSFPTSTYVSVDVDFESAWKLFAENLPGLKTIGFLFHNRNRVQGPRSCVWNAGQINRYNSMISIERYFIP